MERFYDEVSKSLASAVSRRESLRRMGAVLAGAALGQFGLGTAWAAGVNPCKAFCNRCRTAKQRNQCLAVCKACNNNTSRLAGSCGSYTCCPKAVCNGACSNLTSDPNCGACGNDCAAFGQTCCGDYCADLARDFDNCGGCGAACDDPGPWEYGACLAGACAYDCVDGATVCNGACADLLWDPNNCGDCGYVCDVGTTCQNSTCQPNNCVPNCPTNWCGGDGCGGECGCPADFFCMGDGLNMCVPCDGAC